MFINLKNQIILEHEFFHSDRNILKQKSTFNDNDNVIDEQKSFYDQKASINISSEENSKKMSKKYRIDVDFEVRDEFIYYIDDDHIRFCIFKNLKKNILYIAHDLNQHVDIHKCY